LNYNQYFMFCDSYIAQERRIMSGRRIFMRISHFFVWLSLLLLGGVALAQGEATPIAIGENSFGELTAEANVARYSVTATGGEAARIQVLALSEGFVPRFRLVNPAGVEILSVPNPDGLNILTGNASFPDAGVYLIKIEGENNTIGQFTLSLQPGATLPEAVELVIDQPISHVVGSQTPVQVYHFNTTTEPLVLTILTDEPDAGVLISLYDEDAAKTIATSDTSVSGVAYRFPPEEQSYHVEVRAGDEAGDTAYTLCLGNCGSGLLSGEATAESETVAATCTVVSAAGTAVNVRSAPGTQYAVIGNLAAGQAYPVLGQLAGGDWYQVSVNGQTGWVAASVTQLEEGCTDLALVAAPANAQLAATQPPPPTQLAPTQPSSGSTPSLTPSNTPQPTQTPVLLPDLTARIDSFSIDANGFATVNYSYSNIGTAPSIGSFTIELCVDLTCRYYIITDNVSPGSGSGGTTILNTWEADPLAALPTATVTVDAYGVHVESNEDNNVATAYPQ
jgi:hypothetical protein